MNEKFPFLSEEISREPFKFFEEKSFLEHEELFGKKDNENTGFFKYFATNFKEILFKKRIKDLLFFF